LPGKNLADPFIGGQYKLKTITRKTNPMSFDERIQKLNEVQRGWVNNFRMASIYNKLNELDGWLRNRLHYCIWHHWKKPEKKGVACISPRNSWTKKIETD